jgi:hypothetical protein
MDVIRHQAIGMNSNTIPTRTLTPEIKVELVILWLHKTDFTVIAALNDMTRIPRQVHP